MSSAGVAGGDAHAGQPVKLTAVVTNKGTAPTPAGVIVSVTFFDITNGASKMLTYSAQTQDAIAPGKSITVQSDGQWTPPSAGTYKVEALVDDLKRVPEIDRSNDRLDFTIDVK